MTRTTYADYRTKLPLDDLRAFFDENTTDVELAELIGRNRTVIGRWKRHGLMLDMVEDVAHSVGCHPVEIWGRAYYDAVLEQERLQELREARRKARNRVKRIRRDRVARESQNRFCGRLPFHNGVNRDPDDPRYYPETWPPISEQVFVEMEAA